MDEQQGGLNRSDGSDTIAVIAQIHDLGMTMTGSGCLTVRTLRPQAPTHMINSVDERRAVPPSPISALSCHRPSPTIPRLPPIPLREHSGSDRAESGDVATCKEAGQIPLRRRHVISRGIEAGREARLQVTSGLDPQPSSPPCNADIYQHLLVSFSGHIE